MRIRFSVSAALLALAGAPVLAFPGGGSAERPNVLIVLADDLGFSDLGCYGGEIETPNLDRLASDGLRFTQFYNTAKCHSSRISLLTGRYPFQAGQTAMKRAVTAAEVLGNSGYFTAMVGKWGLAREPTDFGFQRYFGHLSSAVNYFLGDDTFRLNGEPWSVPEKGFYTTVAFVDRALEFLGEARRAEQPWFLYLAFNAPHKPLQPLERDYKKYEGRYAGGWDEIRAARVEKQKAIGLFGGSLHASERPEHVRAWKDLGEARRDFDERRMTALAGMIDRVDREVGRLIRDLREAGELENTLILFLSDNGAAAYDHLSKNVAAPPYEPATDWSDSTGWAWARNTPFRYYKQNQFEGGICTPAIVHWPKGLKTTPGQVVTDPVHFIDVLPTLIEVCGASEPETWPGRKLEPMAGISVARILRGEPLGPRPALHLQYSFDRGLRDGNWKAVSFRNQPWELYDLSVDRTETKDLAAEHPVLLARMATRWMDLAENEYRVPEDLRQPTPVKATGHFHPDWTNFDLDPLEERAGSWREPDPSISESSILVGSGATLRILGRELELTGSQADAGISMYLIERDLPVGPYVLTFRVRSSASGRGELRFTSHPSGKLRQGQRIVFEVINDGEWHEHSLRMDLSERITALRLSPSRAPGIVRIADLTLRSAAGESLVEWPESAER